MPPTGHGLPLSSAFGRQETDPLPSLTSAGRTDSLGAKIKTAVDGAETPGWTPLGSSFKASDVTVNRIVSLVSGTRLGWQVEKLFCIIRGIGVSFSLVVQRAEITL